MSKVPGPPPSAVRRRRNRDELAPQRHGTRRGVTVPVGADPSWRKDVRAYYDAAMNSGQSDWMENSDVMTLWMQCVLLDRVLRGGRLVPVYKEERDSEGKYHAILDEDGDPIPELDEFGEQQMRAVGGLNGQALKAVLDMGQDLLTTEGARRKLRIDLGLPVDDSEPIEKAIVARQRAELHKVHQPSKAGAAAE